MPEGWLDELTATAQRILGEGSLSKIDALRALVAGVPRPRTRLEALVLAGLLMELTLGDRRGTRPDFARYVEKLGALLPAEPWSAVARRVAVRIRNRCREPLNMQRLSRDLGVNETTLRAEFKRVFGVPPREYHIRVRVAAALDQLTPDGPKISAVAESVGYRDERNFYNAVRQLTDRTPAELRQLSPAARRRLAAALPQYRPDRCHNRDSRLAARVIMYRKWGWKSHRLPPLCYDRLTRVASCE